MTAELVEVAAAEAQPANGLNLATLEAIRALVKRQRGEAPLIHTDKATGMQFRYRPLTGAERAQARALAVRTGKFEMMEFERQVAKYGMVEPRFDDTFWVALGGVVGGMREDLLGAIQKASGMDADDPLSEPAGDSTPTGESAASGIG